MTSMCLFHMPGACSRVVMNALEEIGVEYEDRPVDLFKGHQRTAEFLAVNPSGKVPVLRVGEQALAENAAILMYLHRQYPHAHLLPAADGPIAQAQAESDLVWCSSTLHPLVRIMMSPARAAPAAPESARQTAATQFSDIAHHIERRIQSGWWYGERWSILDVYLAWCFSVAVLGGFDLAAHRALQEHTGRVRSRPSFQRALSRERAALERAGIQLPPGAAL